MPFARLVGILPTVLFLFACWRLPSFAAAATLEEASDRPQVPDTGGTFAVDRPEFDFGVLRSDDVDSVTHTFTFKNTGSGPLSIVRINASCECTSSILSASDFASGEEGTLTAAIDLHGKMGVSSASIEVLSNDPDNPAQTFVIKGTVLNLWRVVPTQLDMGDIGKGETQERTLKVFSEYFEGETPHNITGTSADDPAVRAEAGEVTRAEAESGQKYFIVERPVRVQVTAGHETGPHSAWLSISTDDPRGVTQLVEVKWNVEGDLALSTKRVIVLKRGETTKPVNLTVNSRSGKPFEVLSIEAVPKTGNQKDLVFTPLPSNSATKKTFRVDLSESVKPGKPNLGEIVIATDDPEQKEIRVPYTASYIAPRSLSPK